MQKSIIITLLLLQTFPITVLIAQESFFFGQDVDPQTIDQEKALNDLQVLGTGWGYNYDSLLTDLEIWSESPYVKVDSAGASVQGRALWNLTITDTAVVDSPKIRVSIHARTHPQEVESSVVTRYMIQFILSDSGMAKNLRQKCIFNIMPMYNPDGVELGYPRENANGLDLERNWDKNPHQPETAVLKSLFENYMTSESPVRVALNMHSSSNGSRYFVFHHANGTSELYTEEEKSFIGNIRNYWPEGIKPWNYFITWTVSTPTHYPESWYWLNYQEKVIALTYEDIYGSDNKEQFQKAAYSLLYGTYDYLIQVVQKVSLSPEHTAPDDLVVYPNYPNPFNASTEVRYYLSKPRDTSILIYSCNGKLVTSHKIGRQNAGNHLFRWDAGNKASGVYYLIIRSGSVHYSQKLILLK